VVAFEAARQLAARGIEVKGFILINSPNPMPLPASIISNILHPNHQAHGPSGKHTALDREFSHNASLLGTYKAEPSYSMNRRSLKTVMLRTREVFNSKALRGVRYDWLSRQDTQTAALSA
jgi:thioesterase domain-containing protein